MKKILAIVLAVVMLLPVFAVNSFAAEDAEPVFSYDFQDKVIKGWNVVLGGEDAKKLVDAMQLPEAKVVLTYIAEQESYAQFSFGGNENCTLDGSVSGEEEWKNQGCDPFYLDMAVSTDVKKFEKTGADLIKLFTDMDGKVLTNGDWQGKHKGDTFHGFAVTDITSVILNTGGQLTIKKLEVFAKKAEEEPATPGTVVEVETPVALNIGFSKGNATIADGAAIGNGDDRLGVTIPEVVAGKKIKLRFVGESNDPFRFWLADGWTSYSAIVPADEAIGYKDGKFDITYEFESTGTSKHLIIGANPSGASFDSFKLKELYVITTKTVAAIKKVNIFTLKTTHGQNFDGKDLPCDLEDDGGYTRIATNWMNGEFYNEIIKALNNPEATFEVTYTGDIEGFIIQTEKGSSDAAYKFEPKEVDGKKVVSVPCADVIASMPFGAKNEEVGWGNIAFTNVNNARLESFEINIITAADPVNRVPGYKGCIYVNDQYHAYLIAGHFLVREHEDNGYGQCKACYTEMSIEADEEIVPQDTIHYDMTAAQGQDTEAAIAGGLTLADNQEGAGNCRIATNWVGGGKVWTDATKAIADNADAFVKIVYTGNVTNLVFQTEKGDYETAVAVTESYKEEDKSVAMISCADIIAASPVALSGDVGGWANMILQFEGDAAIYGFTVMTPAATTTDETIEVVDPTEPGDTDEEPDDANVEEPAEEPVEEPKDDNPPTGIALAVLPMIVAAAACVVSKRKKF